MNNYDTIIIGSGLGGLACGVILSKEGQRVCVVEKEPVAGGCLRSFHRDGVLFDTGMHYVGCMDDGEILNHFLRYCGVYDSLHLQRLDNDGFDVIHTQGREFRFCQGYGAFVDRLSGDFPAHRGQIAAYAEALREVGACIGVEKLRRGIFSDGSIRFMSIAASTRIEELIDDPLLRRVVTGTSLLYDGLRGRSSFYQHAMINGSFIRGACRFAGGSQQLADALCGAIHRNGGEVRCAETVVRVLQQENQIQGVQLASGERIEARQVIADIHPARLLPMIDPGHRIRRSYETRITTAQNSVGMFSVFAAVDKSAFPYRNCNHYLLGSGEGWAADNAAIRPQAVLLSMQPHTTDEGCVAVTLLSPMPFREVAAWEATTVGDRGEAYREFKQRKAEALIRVVDEHFPGFRTSIRSIHTASPLTYRDYTGIPEGSAYGLRVDCVRVMETLLSPKTKVEGLFLTGQNVAFHGALGVVMTAISTCGAIVGNEYIAQKIGNF